MIKIAPRFQQWVWILLNAFGTQAWEGGVIHSLAVSTQGCGAWEQAHVC